MCPNTGVGLGAIVPLEPVPGLDSPTGYGARLAHHIIAALYGQANKMIYSQAGSFDIISIIYYSNVGGPKVL